MIKWTALTSAYHFDEWMSQSEFSQVLLFKHSYSCGISQMVLRRFEKEFDLGATVTCYILDVIAERPYARQIADKLKITHESPQVIVISNSNVVYHASHFEIQATDIIGELTS